MIFEQDGAVRRIDQNEYRVKSQSGVGEYQVFSTEAGWYCSHPEARNRGVECKHIFAVKFSLQLRKEVENQVLARLSPLIPVSSAALSTSSRTG
jgi:hypothetical protein